MALSDANKAALAFKNTQGKAHTATNKELGNEQEEFRFIVGADTVWLSPIGPTPDLSIVEEITASLQPDVTSNGRAFFTYYPEGHPKAGQRIYNVVPSSFGNAYAAVIKGSDNSRIVEFDARDWVYQYQPGVFFQQTANASPTPVSASIYVYKGETLSSSLASGNLGGGGGDSGQWIDTGDAFATTGSVEMAGPEVRIEGIDVVWNNGLVSNYTVDPSSTKELHLVSHYGMTGSILDHYTMFTLDVPTTGTMVDAEFTLLAKNTTFSLHSRFKFSLYVFNQGDGVLFANDLVQTVPNINGAGWDFSARVQDHKLCIDITGSAPHYIDWTLHSKFFIG